MGIGSFYLTPTPGQTPYILVPFNGQQVEVPIYLGDTLEKKRRETQEWAYDG
jgi:hypothetical protein